MLLLLVDISRVGSFNLAGSCSSCVCELLSVDAEAVQVGKILQLLQHVVHFIFGDKVDVQGFEGAELHKAINDLVNIGDAIIIQVKHLELGHEAGKRKWNNFE